MPTVQDLRAKAGRSAFADYNYRKGYDVLFDAYGQLQRQGFEIELHAAGRFTDGADCQKEIARRQLTGVKTYGRTDKQKVRDLLYLSDALVLASRSEVQPLVLLEAMSTGIPVVSTECIPQCLRIEGGCTIVPIDDVAALAEMMARMTGQQPTDGRMISERVIGLASPAVVGQMLSELFDRILHTARQP